MISLGRDCNLLLMVEVQLKQQSSSRREKMTPSTRMKLIVTKKIIKRKVKIIKTTSYLETMMTNQVMSNMKKDQMEVLRE